MRKPRSKQTKQTMEKIMAADPSAVIEVTAQGHLKVTGPGGTAIVPSKPGNNPSSTHKLRVFLARYAGIQLGK